ncbi:hypothetical protein QM306_37610, partial [Burkholderia cenocepacia]|nr:hypothetical protein [Burkholderia cenocepacia]
MAGLFGRHRVVVAQVGIVREVLDGLPEASKLIDKAMALAPNDAYIMDSLGWVKYRMGDTAGATKVLQRAYELQPNAEIGAHLGE